MKKIYLLAFLMLLKQVAIGQIKFEYDASGNRTKRILSTYNLVVSNQTGLSNAVAAGGNNLGSFTVVSSNVNWNITGVPSWASINTSSGTNGSTTVNVTFTANSTTSARSATLTISGNNGVSSQTINISQLGTGTSSSCPDEVLVGKQGDADVVIKHFDSYYVLCTKSVSNSITRYVPRGKNYWTWSGFVKNSNVEQYYTCINTIETNYSGLVNPFASNYVPTGWLSSTFLDPDNNPVLYYYQNVSSPTLTVSPSTWSPSASSNNTSVSVSSNVSWSVSSNQTWLTLSSGSGSNNGTLTLTVTANTGAARTGTVTITGGGLTQTVTVTQATSSSCGDTPQNYCLTGTIPANQFRFYSNYASTNIAGPRSNLDGGTPPFYGNAGWLQGYAGGAGNIIYPTYQNDINLPVASSGYRVDLWWPNSTSKVLRLYVNGVQKWSQATTCQDYCQYYPDFSSVVSGDRVYFSVQENATLRIAAPNDVYQKQEEQRDDALVVSPNPTDGKVKAAFYLSEAQSVRLSVIDTQGRIIGIYDKDADAGTNIIDIDLQQYASGIYLIQLQLNNKQLVTKVMKL